MTLWLWTDGCRRGDAGAWAYAIVHHHLVIAEGVGTVVKGTDARDLVSSNLMEIMAVVEGLEAIERLEDVDFDTIEVRSDSKYLVDGMNRWLEAHWLPANGRKVTKRNGHVSNWPWWLLLHELSLRWSRLNFRWVSRRSTELAQRVDTAAYRAVRDADGQGEDLTELGRRRFAPAS